MWRARFVKPNVEKIRDAVISMLRVNMGLKDGESLLVLTDTPTQEQWRRWSDDILLDITRRALLAKAVYLIAREAFPNCEVDLYVYPCTGRSGAEPVRDVAEAMKRVDVVVAITSFSLTHTHAREEATRSGARIASMPGFTEEMLYPGGPMSVDYREISRQTKKIADALTEAREARVLSPAGTDIRFSLERRSGDVDDGLLDRPGLYGNLPAGEAYIAPVEGTAEGRIVVEAGWYPYLEQNMVLEFSGGEVVALEGGGKVGDHFREVLKIGDESEPYKSRRNLAELGIGTNPNARNPTNVLEAEKIMGTVHLAIGDNAHFGGRVSADLHEDFVIPKPTLVLDGKTVIKDGRHLFST